MLTSFPNGLCFNAKDAADMLLHDAKEGGDTTLTHKQYRRVAKRLRKWGHNITANHNTYYMEVK